MALSTFAITIAVMLLMLFYSVLKLVKWSINSEQSELRGQYVQHISNLFRLAVISVLLLALGPPIGSWLTNAFNFITGAL